MKGRKPLKFGENINQLSASKDATRILLSFPVLGYLYPSVWSSTQFNSEWKSSSLLNSHLNIPFYYTHLKSLVVPVIWLALIGAIYSQIAPLFLLYEEATLKTKQPIRLQGLFKVTDQIAGRWKTWRIMWQILQLLFPKLLFFPPKKWINLIWNWLSIVVTKYLKSCIWAISKWM